MPSRHLRPALFIKSNLLLCALCVSAVNHSFAGPLTPPAGPIAPTPGPEPRIAINAANTPGDADSVFRITQRGSYYLTGNISGVPGKHGIEIANSGVTIDLNGFHLLGIAGSLDGISTTAPFLIDIEVRNGSIRTWGGDGVDFGTVVVTHCVVTNVRSSGNAGHGILTGTGSTVTGCTAGSNSASGIVVGGGSAVAGCTAHDNTITGIGAGAGSTLLGCAAFSNDGDGIVAEDGCTISDCTSRTNVGDGLMLNFGCTVTGCTSAFNGGDGINASSACLITGCTLRRNGLDGIRVLSQCIVRDNSCPNNGELAAGGAGVHAAGTENRIEGNNCTQADRGIEVDLGGNIIIRNTCASNTIDWDIAANNVVGPILDRRAPASAAISGFSAASSLGSTDANANYSY